MKVEIKVRAWHFGHKRMFSPEEMTKDQLGLLPDGRFANIHSLDTRLSTIYSHDEMLPLLCAWLKDKNGTDIYRGDIVLLPDTESDYVDVGVGEVKVAERNVGVVACIDFRHGTYGFDIQRGGEKWDKGFTPFYCTDYTKPDGDLSELSELIEVIGNIYENPEILQNT